MAGRRRLRPCRAGRNVRRPDAGPGPACANPAADPAGGGRRTGRRDGSTLGARGPPVVAGDLEARISAPATGRPDDDRARVEKELAEAEGFLEAARSRLANEAFTSKAPPAVVEGARVREAELAETVERLRARLGR